METPAFVDQTEPESVFALLSDDNRVAILRTLWQRREPMSFSSLYEAVDIDDSGQFNYHLDKLVGQFVSKGEEGYTLTEAGRQINGAIDAGSYTAGSSMEPITLDPPCPLCGGERTLKYENERVTVECDSCDVTAAFGVPPAVLAGRDREAIPRLAGQYLRTGFYRLENGFCTYCNGPVERTVEPLDGDPPWDDTENELSETEVPVVQYECQQCGVKPTSGLSFSLLLHPAVISFYADHDIDIREQSVWTVAAFDPERELISSQDPFRASATFRIGDDELTIVVDDSLETISTERTDDQKSPSDV